MLRNVFASCEDLVLSLVHTMLHLEKYAIAKGAMNFLLFSLDPVEHVTRIACSLFSRAIYACSEI